MGNSCSCVDCCFGLRKYGQCWWPCIQSCSYGHKRSFYNYDGTEIVNPMVAYLQPVNRIVRKTAIPGMVLDMGESEVGMDAVEQIAAVVRHAYRTKLHARAVGTGSSWSKLTSVRDILIDMKNLDRILDVRSSSSDHSVYHVTVQGGMKVHDCVRILDKAHGLAFPAMGNYAGQTVAGIVSTSTHGSLVGTQTMSNFTSGFHLVISGGIQVKVRKPETGETDEEFSSVEERVNNATYGADPLEIVSSDVFRAVAVGLGSMGIIYTVTFDCRKMFNIKERRTEVKIDWPPNTENFRLPEDVRAMYSQQGKFFSLLINPFARNRCCSSRKYVKAVYLAGDEVDYNGCCQCDYCLDCQCGCCCSGCRGKSACQVVQTDCSAMCIQNCAHCCCTQCMPGITDCGLDNFSRFLPYIHKWYNVLTFTNGNIHIKTAEYCLPVCQLESALTDVIKLSQFYSGTHNVYTLLPMYVRFAKADDLYLSPANRHCPDGSICEEFCYIEVPFLPGAFAIDEYHRTLENLLFDKYRARPHWAKNNFLNCYRVSELYPQLNEWAKVFVLFNKGRVFDNQFTNYCGFDQFHYQQPSGTSDYIRGCPPGDAVTSQPTAAYPDIHPFGVGE